MNNSGVKNISSKKSMFDDKPKKVSKEAFEEGVMESERRKTDYRERAAKLSSDLNKIMLDKTIHSNKSPFSKNFESEVLSDLVKLALEVNSDESEPEGAGSISCIILLLNTCLLQRDKINQLEYDMSILKK